MTFGESNKCLMNDITCTLQGNTGIINEKKQHIDKQFSILFLYKIFTVHTSSVSGTKGGRGDGYHRNIVRKDYRSWV